MKKLLIVLFICSLALPCWGGGVMMMGGGVTAANDSACASIQGDNGEYSLNGAFNGYLIAQPFIASASCDINKVYIYSLSSSSGKVFAVGIYSNQNISGTDKPYLLLQSNNTVSLPYPSASWASATITSISLTSGIKYWVAIVSDASSGGYYKYIASGTQRYLSGSELLSEWNTTDSALTRTGGFYAAYN